MTELMFDGPEDAAATLVLAHGAGAAMDSASMNATAAALAEAGIRVVRFEFGYMASRRTSGRRPPPRADTLVGEYRAVLDELGAVPGRLLIGGKSMGGRVASLVADELHEAGRIAGLVCLGYPFHPPDKPTQLRTAHLKELRCPTLIFQGTRDGFGLPDEVANYDLSPAITVRWLADGDHDLKPRKSVSGLTAADHLRTVALTVRDFAKTP
jgi:predicted alpha/beta-hydrolase family hydrolase